MATLQGNVWFAGDHNSVQSTAKLVSAAIQKYRGSTEWMFNGGDTYGSSADASPKGLATLQNDWTSRGSGLVAIPKSLYAMTPGNHDNGSISLTGSSASEGSILQWAAAMAGTGTVLDKSQGQPSNANAVGDFYIDVFGVRWVFINSGATQPSNTPGWPTPHSGTMPTSSQANYDRVTWLRGVWKPGLKNVVIAHHPRWSRFGIHYDNPEMQNLIDEMMGHNDSSGQHAALLLSGHDHCMQIVKPRTSFTTAAGVAYSVGSGEPGIVQCVIGAGGVGHDTGTAGASASDLAASDIQFSNINNTSDGLNDGFAQLAVYDTQITVTIRNCVVTGSAPTTMSGSGTASITVSIGAAVSGTAPTITGTSITGTAKVGQTLTANATFGGTTPITASYQWKVNGVNVGSNQATYQPVAADAGNTATCVINASNGIAPNATATLGPTAVIAAATSAPATSVTDTFTRTTFNDIGTADDLHTWDILQGATSQFDCTGASLDITGIAGNAPVAFVHGFVQPDIDVLMSYSWDKAPTGSAQSIGLALRGTDQTVYDRMIITQNVSGSTSFMIQSQGNPANFNRDIVSSKTITSQVAKQKYWARFRAVGSTYYGKVWKDGTTEPTTWTGQATVAGALVNTTGSVGIRLQLVAANTNLPTYSIYDFIASIPGVTPPNTVTYKYSLDGAAFVNTGNSGNDLSEALTGLAAGEHYLQVMPVDSVNGNGPVSTYAWKTTANGGGGGQSTPDSIPSNDYTASTVEHAGVIPGGTPTAQNYEDNFAGRTQLLDLANNVVYKGGAGTIAGTTGHVSQYVLKSPSTRNHIFAEAADTHALLSWNPNANDIVYYFNKWKNPTGFLYCCGNFTNIGGAARSRVAKLQDITGASPGTADATFNPPTINGRVSCCDYDDVNNVLYISGTFSTVGGSARPGYAALDGTTGAVLAFGSAGSIAGGTGDVRKIKLNHYSSLDADIYLVGEFDHINGSARLGLACIAATSTATNPTVRAWNPTLVGDTTTTKGHDIDFKRDDGSILVSAFAGSGNGEPGVGDGNIIAGWNLVVAGVLARDNTRRWMHNAQNDGGDHNACACDAWYAAAGHHGDGEFRGGTPSANDGSGNRKIYIVDILTGLPPSAPLAPWIPNTQVNSTQGTYGIDFYPDRFMIAGCYSTPKQAFLEYPRTPGTPVVPGGTNTPVIQSVIDGDGNSMSDNGITTANNVTVTTTKDAGSKVIMVLTHADGTVQTLQNIPAAEIIANLVPGNWSFYVYATDSGGQNASDPSPVFHFTMNNPVVGGNGSGTYSRQMVLPGTPGTDVPVTIYVKATDLNSPPITTVVQRQVVVRLPLGAAPPDAQITDPQDGSELLSQDGAVTVTVQATSLTDTVSSVTISGDGITVVNCVQSISDPTLWVGTIFVPLNAVSTIQAIATDSTGLQGTDSINVTQSTDQGGGGDTPGTRYTTFALLPDQPPATLDIYIVDHNGNDVGVIAPQDLDWIKPLNAPATITWGMNLEDSMANKTKLNPDIHDWRFERNGEKIDGGILLPNGVSIDTQSRTMQVAGANWLQYLAATYMDYDPTNDVTVQGVTVTNKDIFDSVRQVLQFMLDHDNSIPLTYDTTKSGSLIIAQQWLASDLNDALSIISDLARQINGFDFEISWDCRLRMYAPQKGKKSNLVLAQGKNIDQVQFINPGLEANNVIGVGAGSGNTQVTRMLGDKTSQVTSRKYTKVAQFSNLTAPTQINNLTKSQLAVSLQDQVQMTVTSRPAAGEDHFSLATVGDYIYVNFDLEWTVIDGYFRCTQIEYKPTNEGDDMFIYSFTPNTVNTGG